MKTLLSFWVFVSLTFFSFSQVCTGDFTFTTQQEIDDFLINNPTCTIIEGMLVIDAVQSETPLNTDGLQNLETIIGDLLIYGDTNMVSLLGLSSLNTINGDVYIDGIMDFGLDGLQGIQTINGCLTMGISCLDLSPLDNLTNLSCIQLYVENFYSGCPVYAGFTGVTELDFFGLEGDIGEFSGLNEVTTIDQISIAGIFGANLDNFDAFHNLESCGSIYMGMTYGNYIGGFENLTECGSIYMEAYSNVYPNFESLVHANSIDIVSGTELSPAPLFNSLEVVDNGFYVFGPFTGFSFQNLRSVGGDFMLQAEPADWDNFGADLADFGPFPMLDSIGGNLDIRYFEMPDLDALSGLDYIGGNIIISDCLNLTDCAITHVCERLLDDPVSVILSNNGVGCTSLDEVAPYCAVSFAAGSIYADLDCDGVYNNNDVPLNNTIVRDENNMPLGTVYSDGGYYVGLPDNSTTTIHATTPVGFLPENEHTFTTTTLDDMYAGYDFSFCPDMDYHDLSVFIYCYGSPRPGFNFAYHIVVENHGANLEQAEVVFDFGDLPGASVINSNSGIVSGTQISWNIGAIDFAEEIEFDVLMSVSASVEIGTEYNAVADVTILPLSVIDNNPSNNDYTRSRTVVGSYDPNDKTVNIPAVNIETLSVDDAVALDYTIRFQNTGTAEAIFVRVEDIIEEDLDLTTFQMLNASHPFQLTFDEDRRVEWLFDNIMLPDSTSDEEGSHGYIHFRINTVPDVLIDYVIENTAAIYFDYNEPVITNTATTIFYECPEELAITTEGNYCEGESIVLLASYGWDNYSWTVNDEPDGTGLGISIDNAAPGIYVITVESTTTYCTSTAGYEFFVEESPDDVVITGDQEICEGENINLTATSAWNNYSWIQNGNEISTTSEVEISEPSAGNYVMQLLTTNVNCASTLDLSFTVFANPDVTIDFPNSVITGPENFDYAWYLWDQMLDGETSNFLDPWMYVDEGFSIYAVVADGNGCIDTTNTIYYSSVAESRESYIKVYPNPMSESTFVKLPAGIFEIELFNAIGQRLNVWSNVQNSLVVNRDQLTGGTYLLKMTNEMGVSSTEVLNVK
jgi:hypothetical protein